jgi:hypothetical protein
MTGFVKLRVVVGAPGGVDDSDVQITGSVTDVRCLAGTVPCTVANTQDGQDYAGELRVDLVLRITDRDGPGTVEDIPFPAEMTCAATTSTSIGGTCALATSADALVPGSAPERQRSVWEVGQVQVSDGGPDGDVATPAGNATFLRQGVVSP